MRIFRMLAIVVVVLAVAVGVGAVFLRRDADESTAVKADRATELAGSPSASKTVDPGDRPVPGTYEYTGSGTEHLSLLGGSTHDFPDTVFAVVALDEDDDCAWSFDPVFVEEHVEHRTYCTSAGGAAVTARTLERTTSFLGHEQTSTYECDEAGAIAGLDAKAATRSRWSCTEDRGATVQFTATVVDRTPITIDGAKVPVTHVRVVGTQRNKGKGDETTELWLLDTGLVARVKSTRTNESSAGPLGTMRLREQYDYALSSTEPTKA